MTNLESLLDGVFVTVLLGVVSAYVYDFLKRPPDASDQPPPQMFFHDSTININTYINQKNTRKRLSHTHREPHSTFKLAVYEVLSKLLSDGTTKWLPNICRDCHNPCKAMGGPLAKQCSKCKSYNVDIDWWAAIFRRLFR